MDHDKVKFEIEKRIAELDTDLERVGSLEAFRQIYGERGAEVRSVEQSLITERQGGLIEAWQFMTEQSWQWGRTGRPSPEPR